MIKVVSFDLGGTILNLDKHSFIGELAAAIGVEKELVSRVIKKYFMTKKMNIDEAARVISTELGIKSQDPIKDFILHYSHDIVLYDDVDRTLSTLKERGYTLIALANHYCIDGVNEIKSLQYFDQYFYSYCIGITKPSREVFLFVEKEIKSSGKEILHVGDSFISDIIGPQGAGWHTAFIERNDGKNHSNIKAVRNKADYVINCLDELLCILE